MNLAAIVDGKRQQKLERTWFSSGRVLSHEVQTVCLLESLRSNSSFELNNLIFRSQLLSVCPSQGNWIIGCFSWANVPDMMFVHVIDLFQIGLLPLHGFRASHGLPMVLWFRHHRN